MKRFLPRLFVTVFVMAGPTRNEAADPAFGKQPNIILVITDDQGYYDLSAHGNLHLATPNLDKLRDDSVRFTRFQVSPTCAPTRSAIMSGRAPFYAGVTHTILSNGEEESFFQFATIFLEQNRAKIYTKRIAVEEVV